MKAQKNQSIDVESTEVLEIPESKISYALKLKILRKDLNQIFFERSELIDLYLSCLISNYSIFVGGPPGTGKTYLANTITQAFNGKSCYRLLQASSTIEEVIGALDLAALDKGVFKRKLENGAVLADTLILDEGFKANSPLLNALLGLILDKVYFNGDDGVISSPLKLTVVCSNELPQDESLAPFWDRLVVRYWVNGLSPDNKFRLMKRRVGSEKTPKITVKLSIDELNRLKLEAQNLAFDDELIKAIINITEHLKKENGILVSDRKHEQIIDIMRAYALVQGKDEVDDDCIEILKHICWDEPKQSEYVMIAINKFGNPLTIKAKQHFDICEALFKTIEPYSTSSISSDEVNAYQSKCQITKDKIIQKRDILFGEIQKVSKSKARTANEYLRKINGFVSSIDAYVIDSYGLRR